MEHDQITRSPGLESERIRTELDGICGQGYWSRSFSESGFGRTVLSDEDFGLESLESRSRRISGFGKGESMDFSMETTGYINLRSENSFLVTDIIGVCLLFARCLHETFPSYHSRYKAPDMPHCC
jgi:hypothetical protein